MTIYYSLRVHCTNCFHKQTVRMRKGIEWHDASWLGSTFECEECGCKTLVRDTEANKVSVGDEVTAKLKKSEEEFMSGSWKKKKGK